jgi:lactoylglutathione lyase
MASIVFDHIHLYSPDPAATADFYQKKFAAKLVSKRDLGNGRIVVVLDFQGTQILISKTADPAKVGLGHFGMRTNNLDEAVSELKAKGVKFTQEITEVRPDFRISFFTAPEGMSVELQQGSI